MDDDYSALELVKQEIDVTRLDFRPEPGPMWRNILRFRKELKAIKPDRLITYNWGAIEWALANFVPICPHVHIEDGFGPEEAERQLPRRVWTRRIALRRRTRVILPSQTLFRLARAVWRLPAGRVQVIPNGIDVSRFEGPPSKAALSDLCVPLDRIHIGTVTALRGEKNISRLIEAFKPNCMALNLHLIVVGDGSEKTELEGLVISQGLQDRVSFLGHCERPEKILAGLDIYALSSDTEQMPLSVLEAMAAGLPIASTDVGDVKAMLSDQNQPFVSGRDVDQLAKSLAALAQSDDLRKSIGQANRARVAQIYSLAAMSEAYRDILTQEGIG